MTLKLKSKPTQWLLLAGMLLLILVLFCLNATRSALWYDESIEYYYSKVASGPVPGGRATASMYERITETSQPPLYNWLMHFWLRLRTDVFWFRLFNVILGTVAGIVLYRALRMLCGIWATT